MTHLTKNCPICDGGIDYFYSLHGRCPNGHFSCAAPKPGCLVHKRVETQEFSYVSDFCFDTEEKKKANDQKTADTIRKEEQAIVIARERWRHQKHASQPSKLRKSKQRLLKGK